MGKNRVPKEESNASLSKRRENIFIPFENENELIELVVEHLAYQYQKSFKDLKETDKQEYNRKVEKTAKFKVALTKLLKIKMRFCKNFKITRKSFVLKIAFKMAKIRQATQKLFGTNIEYKVSGLELQIIK